MNKERNSNFELMRIVSMFLIIVYHIIFHGHVLENVEHEGVRFLIELIEFFTIVHVNSFVLLTGYYQSNSNFKQSSIWKIVNSSLFYKLMILIFLSLFGIIAFSKLDFLISILPMGNIKYGYWFINNYILLYLLSPFLNVLIKKIDGRNYKRLLVILFIVISIIPNITGQRILANTGFSLYNFVYLYLIGAYLKKYPLKKHYFFKIMSKNMIQVILCVTMIFIVLLNHILYRYSLNVSGINPILDDISNMIQISKLNYSQPLIIIQSITYFLLFETFVIKNKFINKLSKLVFGVYLIHDNYFLKQHLYKWLRIDRPIHSYKFILYMFAVALAIYVVCLIIEWLRQKIFKFVYNLKISKKIRKQYYDYISDISITIN